VADCGSIEQANELTARMNFHTVPLGACGESRQVGFAEAADRSAGKLMDFTTVIGLYAAKEMLGHRFSWGSLPQDDLTLAAGVALWALYGFLKRDIVIIIANAVSFVLLMGILYFKLREHGVSGGYGMSPALSGESGR
jgi:hypothetical protein